MIVVLLSLVVVLLTAILVFVVFVATCLKRLCPIELTPRTGVKYEVNESKPTKKSNSIMGETQTKIAHTTTDIRRCRKGDSSPGKAAKFVEAKEENPPEVDGAPHVPLDLVSTNVNVSGEFMESHKKEMSEELSANGVAADSIGSLLSDLSECKTMVDMKKHAAAIDRLKETDIVDKLKSDPVRAKRIDEIVNSQFAKSRFPKASEDDDDLQKLYNVQNKSTMTPPNN
ncbi:MAG: hypothetical protein SNH79_07360 [Rikenellaceae bacterium]